MTYTAQNITQIKRDGNTADYIAMEKKLIAGMESAVVKFDEYGKDTVSFGHLYGYYGIDMETASPAAVASIAYGEWTGSWSLRSFENDQARGLAYARAALKNRLEADAKEILAKAKARLASLEAAI